MINHRQLTAREQAGLDRLRLRGASDELLAAARSGFQRRRAPAGPLTRLRLRLRRGT